jgi:hypothetical protein
LLLTSCFLSVAVGGVRSSEPMFCGGCCRMIGRLQLCVLLAAVARANEKVIAVPSATVPCPPYSPTCGNTWTGTANVGDTCFEACQVNSGDNPPTRWCPTTSDTSGNTGTPWGWCVARRATGLPAAIAAAPRPVASAAAV